MAFSISYVYRLQDRFSAPLKKISSVQEKFVKITNKAQMAMKNFGDRLNNLHGALAGIGGAIIGYAILDSFVRFEKAMNQLSAVSMGTRSEMKAFRDLSLDLGATTKFTAGEVASGMVYLKMAGLSTQEVLQATAQMLNLAAAGNLSLAEASDLATNMLMQQGLAVEELTRVSDNLATVQTTSNTSILEASGAMKNVLTTAAGLGFELEHTTALIGAMANVGIKDTEAGTLLRNAMLRLVNPSKEARRTFRKLNIELKDFVTPEGKIKNFNELLSELVAKGAGTREIFKIFQERGGRAMMALMRVGKDALEDLITLQEEGVRVGMAGEMARRQMAGIPGMIVSLRSAAEALQIALVETGLAEFLQIIGDSLTKFLRNLTKVHPLFLSFVGIFGALGLVVVAVTAAILILTPVFAALMNPVGIVIAAIVTLIALWASLFKKSEKLRAATWRLQNALAPLGRIFKHIMGLFGKENVDAIDLFAEAILILVKAIELLMKPVEWLANKFFPIAKPEGIWDVWEAKRKELVRDPKEKEQIYQIRKNWQELLEKEAQRITTASQQIKQQQRQKITSEINGTIGITTSPGVEVETTTLEMTQPGNLGFNMGY